MKYIVYAQYEHQGYQANEIISIHKNYELALKSCKNHSMRAIREAPEGSKPGENYRALGIKQGL